MVQKEKEINERVIKKLRDERKDEIDLDDAKIRELAVIE